MSMDEAQSDLERWHIKALFRRSMILTLVLSIAFANLLYRACQEVSLIASSCFGPPWAAAPSRFTF